MKALNLKYLQLNKTYAIAFIFFLIANYSSAQTENVIKVLDGINVTDIKNDGKDLWLATEGDGVFKYIFWKKKWINYSTSNKKLKQDFFHCIEVGRRYVWAGSTDGLYIFNKKKHRWKVKKFKKGGKFGNWIRALKYDKKKRTLWIGRFKYLSKYDLRKKRYYDYNLTKDKNEKTNSIKSLYLDGDSLLWIGTEAGLHKFNKKGNLRKKKDLYFYDNNNNYFNSEGKQVSITSMLTEQNNIWYGTDEFVTAENPDFNLGGLFKFDRKIDWYKFNEQNGLPGNGIFDIELVGNYIWVAVYKFNRQNKQPMGKGIAIINRVNNSVITVQSPFLPDQVNALHFDGENIWLGAKDGLYRVRLKNDVVANFNY